MKFTKTKRTYPYFGYFPRGLVVWFTAPNTGVAVAGPKLGEFNTTWAEYKFAVINGEMSSAKGFIRLPDVQEKDYPYFGEHIHSRFVVLFVEPNCGTIVKVDGKSCLAGAEGVYEDSWEEREFIRISGTLEL